jgi:hypothetical protein
MKDAPRIQGRNHIDDFISKTNILILKERAIPDGIVEVPDKTLNKSNLAVCLSRVFWDYQLLKLCAAFYDLHNASVSEVALNRLFGVSAPCTLYLYRIPRCPIGHAGRKVLGNQCRVDGSRSTLLSQIASLVAQ